MTKVARWAAWGALLLGAAGCWAEDAADAAAGTEPAGAADTADLPKSETPVSNVFFQTTLADALTDLASQAGVTVIPDRSVEGVVTMELTEVPFRDALELVLMYGGYVYKEVRPDVYLVTTADPTAPNFALVAETRVTELDYVNSADLKLLLPPNLAKYVSLDATGQRCTVTAPASLADRIVQVIRDLDQPPVQVMIEALIVESSRGDLDEFRLNVQRTHFGGDSGTGVLTYVDAAEEMLSQLLWLVSKSKAKVKASPRIIAPEGGEADVTVSLEQYFEIVTGRLGFEYTQLQAIEANIGLKVRPNVAFKDRLVTVELTPEVGDVTGTSVDNLPIITRRSANTTVRVKDGQIIAVGGLLEEVESEIRRKIPLLGDLPLVGHLFRSKEIKAEDREVTIFVVPHILDESGRFEGPLLMDRLPAALQEAAGTAATGAEPDEEAPAVESTQPSAAASSTSPPFVPPQLRH